MVVLVDECELTQDVDNARMGAAIRYAIQCLLTEPAERRLLLLLTDGKPNDLEFNCVWNIRFP